MQNKASVFILGVGIPLIYYFYRDVVYDVTADLIGDKSRRQRKLRELEAKKQMMSKKTENIQSDMGENDFSGFGNPLPDVTGRNAKD